MEYIKSISIISILIAAIVGHAVPYVGLIIFSIITDDGVQSISVSFVIVGVLFLIAPIITGYLAAKYSKSLPVLNGMLATIVGIALYFTHGSFNFLWLAAIFILLSLLLGYLGARRFVVHG